MQLKPLKKKNNMALADTIRKIRARRAQTTTQPVSSDRLASSVTEARPDTIRGPEREPGFLERLKKEGPGILWGIGEYIPGVKQYLQSQEERIAIEKATREEELKRQGVPEEQRIAARRMPTETETMILLGADPPSPLRVLSGAASKAGAKIGGEF